MNIELELTQILKGKKITTVFQPIVNLKTAEILGYEALSRGPLNSPLYLPDKLFKAAEIYNKSWELESLCRTKAIEKSSGIGKDKYLFLNVDPQIFKDEKFKKGFTKEFLAIHNISLDSIIFEITEKSAIEDYNSFKIALDNYVKQGYKIAIDDTGAGYSGLKTLSEIKPHYIKIDMDLIRNIDKDTFKQAIMKAFVSLASITDMKLIAEGIETQEELITLINLGVYAGQGFFLLRPAATFVDIPEKIKYLITKTNGINQANVNNSFINIGSITRKDIGFSSSTLSNDLNNFFNEKSVTGVCIVENDKPVGLVMKHYLNLILAKQYETSDFLKRPISFVMDSTPLIVDYYTSISEVTKLAMDREPELLYDYIIITKNMKYHGVVTIKNLLENTTILEKRYLKELNRSDAVCENLTIKNGGLTNIGNNYVKILIG